MTMQNYINRMAITRILTWLRNTFVTVGTVCMLPLVILAEGDELMQTLFWGGLLIASIMFFLVVCIEFSVIYLISKGGDMYFKPIFAWNIYFEDNSYKTWLKTNHMPNTAKNFRKYFKEKA